MNKNTIEFVKHGGPKKVYESNYMKSVFLSTYIFTYSQEVRAF